MFEKQRIMQIGVVDSNMYRILENKDQSGFSDANIQMKFLQKFDKKDYFYNN